MSPLEILVIGPNPALQKTLSFDTLSVDRVNRARHVRVYTGGKGTNFCRAAACYRESHHFCQTTLFTFVGGETGTRVVELLGQEGISTHPIQAPGETRTCITCLDAQNGTMTELIEPSSAVPPASADAMDDALRQRLPSAAGLAIMGSLPDHTSPELYTRWVQMAAAAKKPVLIDAVGGIMDSLKVAGASSILKINLEELLKITGKSNLDEAFCYAMREWGISILAVTDGPRTAYIQERDSPMTAIALPTVDNVVSPLGAGDTADAIFLSEYVNGTTPVEAFRRGLAAASANCLQKDAGVFEMKHLEAISDAIQRL